MDEHCYLKYSLNNVNWITLTDIVGSIETGTITKPTIGSYDLQSASNLYLWMHESDYDV